jgi:hypothetical protein
MFKQKGWAWSRSLPKVSLFHFDFLANWLRKGFWEWILSWPLGRYTDTTLNSELVCVLWSSCLSCSVLLFKTRAQELTQLSQEQTTSLYQHWSPFIDGGQCPKNTNSGQDWVCLGMSLWLYSCCCQCVLGLCQGFHLWCHSPGFPFTKGWGSWYKSLKLAARVKWDVQFLLLFKPARSLWHM